MPELPEVETIKCALEGQITGRTVIGVTLKNEKIIAHPSSEEFIKAITSSQITAVRRRGKFLLFPLDNGGLLSLHLRMTGQVLVTPESSPEEKHTHLILHLDNKMQMRYADTRAFGRFWLFGKGEKDSLSGIDKLGPEPFDPSFSAAYLQRKLGRRRRSVKECLLEQGTVAGIGNIYGDEILFQARICPSRPAESLTEEEWRTLASAIPSVLKKAVELSRMTPEEYQRSGGPDYRAETFLQVYGHHGEPCPRCQTALKRIVLSGRSSVFCPSCQKEAAERPDHRCGKIPLEAE